MGRQATAQQPSQQLRPIHRHRERRARPRPTVDLELITDRDEARAVKIARGSFERECRGTFSRTRWSRRMLAALDRVLSRLERGVLVA
jgi:hypothetical protein